MHTTPDLRVLFEVWITGSGSVIVAVLLPGPPVRMWQAE
jgi:hypothetical protein